MADFGYLSQKIRSKIDGILCQSLMKRTHTLPSGRYVSLCFDDFPQSAALNAAPIIEALDWRATWYVAGGFEGTEDPSLGTMYTESDLIRLIKTGHDIGCHTFDHTNCAAANVEEIAAQHAINMDYLANRGVRDIQSFAFPFGAVDMASKRYMETTGFALRSVNPGTNRGQVDFNMLKACGLQDNQGGILRAIEELEDFSEQEGWLIIFTHDVREDPSPWGVTPEVYDHLLHAIAMSGAEVVTVGDMIKRMDAVDAPASNRAA